MELSESRKLCSREEGLNTKVTTTTNTQAFNTDGEESPCKPSLEQSARIHSCSRRQQAPSMALLSSCLAGEVAFRLLFSPLGSKALARTACIVGGLAIPAYSSFKAIELKDTTEQEQWLLYWTAYGCLSAVEVFSDKLLSWLPGYYHAKLAFLMWLQLPLRNGSRQFLSTYLRPPLLRYQCMLDGIVNGARNDINNFLVAYLQELKFIKAIVRKLAQYVLATQKNVKGSSKFIDETDPDTKPVKGSSKFINESDADSKHVFSSF